jgi:hypothetical protein
MPPLSGLTPSSRSPRSRPALVVAGCAVASALVTGACLIAPPPDLPQPPVHRPTILHDAVFPHTDQILTTLPPQGFIVPVELEDPNELFCYNVFVDFDPYNNRDPALATRCQSATPATADGGVFQVSFGLNSSLVDPTFCHRIEFIVAAGFNADSPHTPNSIGGDSVTWLYSAAGGGGCPAYDASLLGDSGWPMPDAGPDVLPVTPESGSDP